MLQSAVLSATVCPPLRGQAHEGTVQRDRASVEADVDVSGTAVDTREDVLTWCGKKEERREEEGGRREGGREEGGGRREVG